MLVTLSVIIQCCLADPTNFDHIAQILQIPVKDSEVGGNEPRIRKTELCACHIHNMVASKKWERDSRRKTEGQEG